jgi:hypothetical protein
VSGHHVDAFTGCHVGQDAGQDLHRGPEDDQRLRIVVHNHAKGGKLQVGIKVLPDLGQRVDRRPHVGGINLDLVMRGHGHGAPPKVRSSIRNSQWAQVETVVR